MSKRNPSHRIYERRYKQHTRELQAEADASSTQPVQANLSERYGLVWRGPRAVEVQRGGRCVKVFNAHHSAGANWREALAWAQDEERMSYFRTLDNGTCPTANGHDLELWDRVLDERKAQVETA